MSQEYKSMSLANPEPGHLNATQKSGLALGAIGILLLFVAMFGIGVQQPTLMLSASTVLMFTGALVYGYSSYMTSGPGIKNHGIWHRSLTNRGTWGWIAGIILTGYYCLLYWAPTTLGLGTDGAANSGMIALFDPLSRALNGNPASQWFMYGTLYTIAIFAMGIKFIWKYRHNKYQILRTISVMFFQLGFAYLLPAFLEAMEKPYYDYKNMWPLNYYFFQGWSIDNMINSGTIGMSMLIWGFLMMIVVSPILTYFYGKRWYCSWVCGCGGLAETAGDPWRHLSDKSLKAWKIERWLIHVILVLVLIMSAAAVWAYVKGKGSELAVSVDMMAILMLILFAGLAGITYAFRKKLTASDLKARNIAYIVLGVITGITVFAWLTGQYHLFFIDAYQYYKWYAFLVGAAFAGVIGVGFYPLMGSRVWCRFGCPMAAILGLQQKLFSRFRITTNGGQCISCGNCSTYCEMGIDVRSYAQKGQDVVRASCVGCGICAAVCPRGVLRLENGTVDLNNRTEDLRVIHISADEVSILS
ncbi:MAG: 4Fe-4S dicluster domain-containing protein [Bacteroidota bacterium]